MELVNMQLTPEEAKENDGLCCSPEAGGEYKGPKYPWGLCVRLDDESLKKLGIETPPAVGTKMTLVASVEVAEASMREDQEGKNTTVELQITDMALAGQAAPSRESQMYPNSKMT